MNALCKIPVLVFLFFHLLLAAQTEAYDLALSNVTLFDAESTELQSHKTILINADTIAAIVDGKADVRAKRVIEGQNRLLTPGFIDTHTHIKQNYEGPSGGSPSFLPESHHQTLRAIYAYRYLNHGVTTTVDMGQPENWMEVTLNWQKNPSAAYPNMFICGGAMISDFQRTPPQHHVEVMGPEDGRKKVREYAEKGLRHMKFYKNLKAADMAAMVDEAKKHQITVNAHVDYNIVTIKQAMQLGIRNFEHFFTVLPDVLDFDLHWPLMNQKYGIQMSPSIDEYAAHMVFFFSYIRENADFDQSLKELFSEMAKNEATLSTALNVLASAIDQTAVFTSFEHFPIRNEPDTKYSAAQLKQLKKGFDDMMHYVKLAHDMGVKLRIGTDSRNGGQALQEELLLLNKAGIPVAEVLQIATFNGYRAMKLEKNWGSIEVGKKADILLFDKNPFDNATHFRSKKTIIKDGKVYSPHKSLAFDLYAQLVNHGLAATKLWYVAQKDLGRGFTNEIALCTVFKELFSSDLLDDALWVHTLFKQHFPNRKIVFGDYILVNATYRLLQRGKYQKAIDYHDAVVNYFPDETKTAPLALTLSLLKEGQEAAMERFRTIRNDKTYLYDEAEMNAVAYLLFGDGKTDEAIQLFKMNVEAFPKSWNVYDSLGEAYAKTGQKDKAIEYYKKSLALNPESKSGLEALQKLE